jgi:NAD(P)H dehydrogenase (quinone)
MKAHFILCHPDPHSYNAHLVGVGADALTAAGWQVTTTDLYQEGFDPLERHDHYVKPQNKARFDVQLEQRAAAENGTIPDDVKHQIALLEACDLLIIQYPMWWHLPPAILKGWMDRVFVYGDVYTSRNRFENGRFAGKRAMLSVTVGTSPETCHHNGRSGDIDLLLWPVNFSLAYVGFEVVTPFVAYGVEAGLRYSSAAALATRLKTIETAFAARLGSIDTAETVPFNRMADWGDDGHIRDDAPVYSPFVRHAKNLKLDTR